MCYLGGQTEIRPYWRCYYPNTKAFVFIIDSSDKDRLEIAKQELFLVLQEEELKNNTVVILPDNR